MAQHDYVIANQSGSAFRADLNNALSATVTGNSGSSAPSTTYAYMIWNDTTSNQRKIRNSANNAWIVLSTLSGGNVFDDDVTFNGASYNLVWDKSDNALEFADNAKCTFGAGDLNIYHDTNNSYIKHSGTGNLYIDGDTDDLVLQAGDDVRIQAQGNEDAIKCIGDGSVQLFYDGSTNPKFETVSGGVNVVGYVNVQSGGHVYLENNGKLMIGTSSSLQIYHSSDNNSYIEESGTGSLVIKADDFYLQNAAGSHTNILVDSDGRVELAYNGDPKFETLSTGAQVTGKLGVNRNTSGFSEMLQVATFDTGGFGIAIRHNHDSAGSLMRFSTLGGSGEQLCGSINGSGTSTSFNTSSDYRLKENEVNISDGITRLKLLKPYRFNWKSEPSRTEDGFFAHEVTPVVPEAISGEKDAPIDEAGAGYQQIDYGKLVPLLTAALQEAITKIETLETKVAVLEAK